MTRIASGTVNDYQTATFDLIQFGDDDPSVWHRAIAFEHAPELKPQYQLLSWLDWGAGYWALNGADIVCVSVAGEPGTAERAVRAALDALHPEGWEEVK